MNLGIYTGVSLTFLHYLVYWSWIEIPTLRKLSLTSCLGLKYPILITKNKKHSRKFLEQTFAGNLKSQALWGIQKKNPKTKNSFKKEK